MTTLPTGLPPVDIGGVLLAAQQLMSTIDDVDLYAIDGAFYWGFLRRPDLFPGPEHLITVLVDPEYIPALQRRIRSFGLGEPADIPVALDGQKGLRSRRVRETVVDMVKPKGGEWTIHAYVFSRHLRGADVEASIRESRPDVTSHVAATDAVDVRVSLEFVESLGAYARGWAAQETAPGAGPIQVRAISRPPHRASAVPARRRDRHPVRRDRP